MWALLLRFLAWLGDYEIAKHEERASNREVADSASMTRAELEKNLKDGDL